MALYIWVALGGMLGAISRFGVSRLLPFADPARHFPWATLGVNLLGCLVLGIVAAFWKGRDAGAVDWKLLLGTGFCGAFTTFSTFSLETIQLLELGRWGAVSAYWAATLILGLGFTYAGLIIGKNL